MENNIDSTMNYQETLDYIYSFIDYEIMRIPRDAGNYDLRRMYELLERLGNPQEAARSIHVAGTNGKGSTAAMIASALQVSGYNVGFYTSPHLIDLRERIKFNGEMIAKPELIELVQQIKPEIEAVNEKATHGKLTTFEVLTALAFAYYKQKNADFQVMEVGLGGRLDATNVIYPEICLITSISLDHTEVLGNTLSKIAREKAGIIKPGSVVVSAPQEEEAEKVIEEVCAVSNARQIKVGKDITWRGISSDINGQALEVTGRLDKYELTIPLLGDQQFENAAMAVSALEALAERGFNISHANIVDGLAQVKWPGRFQILKRKPYIVADGGHNPEAVGRLKNALEHYFGISAGKRSSIAGVGEEQVEIEKAIMVFGASFDKDVSKVVSELSPLFDRVFIAVSRHPRALEAEKIQAEFARHDIEAHIAESVATALSRAIETANKKDLICVTGSFFVVAEAIEYLEGLTTR